MNEEVALNIAITCIVSSALDTETKQTIIGILTDKMTSDDALQVIYRGIEEIYNAKHKKYAIDYEQGFLDGLETALNAIDTYIESEEK